MWGLIKFLVGLIVIAVLLGVGIYASGNTLNVIAYFTKPAHDWDLSKKAPDPDYANPASWAAFPGRESPAGHVPQGVTLAAGARAVDVFFVHPTGFMNGSDWNSPLNPASRTEENTKWMMANQASVFNGCCNVYAPRYREASIFRYFSASPELAEKIMDFAYADVVRAFEHYLAHENKGKPFIIASHSQGTTHAFRLIKDKIDGTHVEASMIAAYIIGSQVTNKEANALKSVKVCDSPEQTGCIVHYAAMGEGGSVPDRMADDLVCVNPLSWKRDGGRVEASGHQGGVPVSGQFSMKLWGDDASQGMSFPPLQAPIANVTWAECKGGMLWAKDLAGTPFGNVVLPGKNYHGLDYPLFHMDLRMNAEARVAAYLQRALSDGAAVSAPPVK